MILLRCADPTARRPVVVAEGPGSRGFTASYRDRGVGRRGEERFIYRGCYMGLRTGSSLKQRAVTALNRVSGPPHGVSNVAARTNHGAGTVYPGARLLGPPESLTATARTNHSARTVSPGPRSRGPTGSPEVGPRSGHSRGRGEGTDLPRLPGSPDTRVPFRCFAVVCAIPPSFEPEFGEKTAPSLPTGPPPAGMVAARFGRYHERYEMLARFST